MSCLVSGLGCRHDRREAPTAASATVLAVVPEPAGLLLRGALRQPSAVYRELQRTLGGRARFLPNNLSVAIATTFFDAPLSAGLIDDGSPMALCVLRNDGGDTNTVAALRLTSGRELVAAVTTGSDARFTARKDASGVTVLSRAAPDPRVALGVFADRLLFSDSEASLLAAGPFLARSERATNDGPELELVAPRSSLQGPLAAALRAKIEALRDAGLLAEAVARQRHGGRAPDFGDPSAVVAIVSSFAEGFVAALASGVEARVTATLSAELPVMRAELTPGSTGSARELTDSLATGALDALLTLPDWVQAGVFSRVSPAQGPDAGAQSANRLEAVLGDRLSPRDRARLRAWLSDVGVGIGDTRIAGVFDDAAFGVFALGTAGDAAALKRATLSLPSVASASAIAAPLRALVGRFDFVPAASPSKDVAALGVRVSSKNGAASRPSSVSAMTSSIDGRVVVLAAHDDPAQKMRDLLAPDGTRTLAHDASVVSAVARAGANANAAAFVRVQDGDGGANAIVLTFGSDRKVTWAEVGASKVAVGTLLRAWVGR
ncbi:MAG TPA: hypothetical protein VHC69_11460 [Polyangiaceae bacterium]|nr:hypothetical protein [Polyangiaceae bacterium]